MVLAGRHHASSASVAFCPGPAILVGRSRIWTSGGGAGGTVLKGGSTHVGDEGLTRAVAPGKRAGEGRLRRLWRNGESVGVGVAVPDPAVAGVDQKVGHAVMAGGQNADGTADRIENFGPVAATSDKHRGGAARRAAEPGGLHLDEERGRRAAAAEAGGADQDDRDFTGFAGGGDIVRHQLCRGSLQRAARLCGERHFGAAGSGSAEGEREQDGGAGKDGQGQVLLCSQRSASSVRRVSLRLTK